jgi:hypothetical protein
MTEHSAWALSRFNAIRHWKPSLASILQRDGMRWDLACGGERLPRRARPRHGGTSSGVRQKGSIGLPMKPKLIALGTDLFTVALMMGMVYVLVHLFARFW